MKNLIQTGVFGAGICLLPFASQAQNLYWGSAGATNSWGTAANWYTDADETTPSLVVPTASDNLFFNTNPDNTAGGTVSVAATIAANSLTFNTTAGTLIQSANSTSRTFNLGTGGITMNAGAGNVTFGGTSNTLAVVLGGSQTWTNNSAGRLQITNGFRTATDVSSTLTLAGSGTGGFQFNNTINNSGTGVLTLVVDTPSASVSLGTSSNTFTGGAQIKNGAVGARFLGLFNTGQGTVTLGDTTGSGNASLNLVAGGGGTATNDIIVLAGSSGTAALTNSGNAATFGGALTLNKDFSLGGGGLTTVSGLVSGVGKLTVTTGNGGVTLTNANTYSGGTTLASGGVLRINNGGTSTTSSIGTGALAINGGSLDNTSGSAVTLATNNSQTWDANFTFVGTNDLNLGTGAVSLGTAAGTARTITTTAGNLTVDGVISNGSTATGLSKNGAGTLTLNGLSDYTGITTVSTGTMAVSSLNDGGLASSVGASSNAAANLVISNGATLRYTGSGSSSNRSFTVNGATATLDASGSGALNLTNTGNLAYGTTNQARNITLGGSNTGANTFALALGNNGSGATSLTKSGSGTWILTGAKTYTGATTINGGTLLVNGTLAAGSAVALNSGTLGGSGTINGLVTTAGLTSVIAAGNSPGTLTLNGGLNAAAGATFAFELGASQDLISLGSGVFTGSSNAGELVFEFSDSGGLLAGNAYTLFTFGSSTGLDYGDFAASILPSGYMLDSSFGTGGFLINGNNLQVQFAAVPEPSTYALLGLGLGALWVLRRKQNKV